MLGTGRPLVSGEGLKLPDATTDHRDCDAWRSSRRTSTRVIQSFERGRLVQVYAYVPGTSLDEPVALGVVESLSKVAGGPVQNDDRRDGELLAGGSHTPSIRPICLTTPSVHAVDGGV